MEQCVVALFMMPWGEILSDDSACDEVNIRAGGEKIFSHHEISS